jgi:hypothetical protein
MLMILPGFFALGFCLGYFSPSWRLREAQRRPVGERSSYLPDLLFFVLVGIATVLLGLLAVAVFAALPPPFVALFGFDHFPTPQTWTGYLLGVAGVVVGAMAGAWFKEENGSRDKIIFIAGASAFLFLAALEYDHRLFGNLAKIGGSEFSVEFSTVNIPARSKVPELGPNSAPTGLDYLSSSFSGAAAIDLTVDTLTDLPELIVKDNQYALLFSHADVQSDRSVISQMPVPTENFLLYACFNVAPFAAQLQKLQEFNRSETSVLAIEPELVSALRRKYLRLRGWPELTESSITTTRETGAAIDHNDDNAFGTYFRKAEASTANEIAAIGGISDVALTERCKAVLSELNRKAIHFNYHPNRIPYTHYFPEASFRDQEAYGFFAYFAFVVALAEVGVGARESAVHLLENEITLERENIRQFLDKNKAQQIKHACSGSPIDVDCESSQSVTVGYLQRVVILLRLEATQFDIIRGLSSNALNRVRLRKLVRMIDDYDDALLYFDPGHDQRASLARTSFYDSRPALCGPDVQSMNKTGAGLFARFWLAELSKKNLVLDYIGRDPSVVGARPANIERFDGFAEDLALIDMSCLARLGAILPGDVNQFRARQLDSLGAYWGVKGENFGSGNDDQSLLGVNLDVKVKVKALCDSKAAYSRAFDYTKAKDRAQKLIPNRYDSLDNELTYDESEALPFTIQNGLARTKQALDAYPAADVASACQ